MVQVLFRRLPHGRDLPLPAAATTGAAGLDVRAAVGASEPVTLKPGERAAIPTGLIMIVPEGHEAQIRPRSGLALRHGVTCLNTPGTIDSDYRGEVQVLLINLGREPFVVERGMRVAQMVIAPVVTPQVAELESPPDATTRGEGGFGSTGTQ